MIKLRGWWRAGLLACLAVLVAACASSPSNPQPQTQPQGPNLSGSWVLTTESEMGAQDLQMTVRQSGHALTGTITGPAGIVDYNGSLNGSAVAFDFTINVQGNDLKLDYTGTVEGDTMTGKTVFGQFGEGTFTAKRK